MSVPKLTRHQCPICKDIIYNNVVTFHNHLNNLCATTLFSKYPGLQTEAFNSLWYKLDSMVKEELIIASNQLGIPAIIYESRQPPPQYYNSYSHRHNNHNNRMHMRQRIGGNISGSAMDLEDLDQEIEYLQVKEKEREKNKIFEKKRRRQEIEQEISNEINNDSFTLSMPKLNDNNNNNINPRKKRKLLYHNTSDIRPPKRVNIDPIININLFQYKIGERRREYHSVSYNDFVIDFYGNKENKCQIVDHNSPIIHTQKALNKYLLNCQILRKCFNGKLFEKIIEKKMKIKNNNLNNNIQTILREIQTWNKYEIINNENTKDNKNEFSKEDFLNSWDAISQQTMQHHLDKLLERQNLVGFYSKIDKSVLDENNSDKRFSFWNATNNVKHVGYNQTIFKNAQNKKFIKL